MKKLTLKIVLVSFLMSNVHGILWLIPTNFLLRLIPQPKSGKAEILYNILGFIIGYNRALSYGAFHSFKPYHIFTFMGCVEHTYKYAAIKKELNDTKEKYVAIKKKELNEMNQFYNDNLTKESGKILTKESGEISIKEIGEMLIKEPKEILWYGLFFPYLTCFARNHNIGMYANRKKELEDYKKKLEDYKK